MTENKDIAIQTFLSHFDGDIFAAQKALALYKTGQATSYKNPPLTEDTIISIKDLTKHYKKGRRRIEVLKNITLNIQKSEIVAITGPSGSGKSTLLHILGCLDKPSAGTILVNKQSTTKLSDAKLSKLRRSTIGFVFQSFYLQPFLRLGDNVAVPAMFTNTKRRVIDANVATLLQQIGLTDRSKHFPKELSGGQVQRAAIARALINRPHIILADEPTGNLDSKNTAAIMQLFETIRQKLGTTIIIVTHDEKIAAKADRIIRIEDGAIA